MLKYIFLCFILTTFMYSLAADGSLGASLEKRMWDNIKAHNWILVDKNIASNFQSAHEDGSRNKDQEIDLIKKLNLGSYQITNLKTTEHGGVIVVTYTISVGESTDPKRLSQGPYPCLSIWKNNNGNWQWIAHSNLSRL
jgi:hypothetical protein